MENPKLKSKKLKSLVRFNNIKVFLKYIITHKLIVKYIF